MSLQMWNRAGSNVSLHQKSAGKTFCSGRWLWPAL